ncbi:MAG TPA: L,D-transpeptidase family protein, partial [Longimicrobiales bacterium]|nr:L,D-transpeptidase family protein [Longimicrobiales bacterium]
YDLLQQMIQHLETKGMDDAAKAQYSADVDVLLTEAFTRYTLDLSTGTLNPDSSSGLRWKIPRGPIPKENVLRALIRGAEPEKILNQIRPAVPQYPRLMKTLARLNEVANKGGWGAVPAGTIKKGDSSDVVLKLRQRLAQSEDVREATYAQRGGDRPYVYDENLWLALKHFQARTGNDDDGALGARTLRELNRPIAERLEDVKLNMDRWRWLPHDLGQMYVLVNVAGYEMSVIENNRAIENMNVVVGKTGWETPIFADTMIDMVVNPSWNVPPSIANDEMASVSEEYLASHHFVRTKDGGYRQLPGPDNALGEFKFEFPNKDNIYLHDTPADALFSRADRAFSHGCIRLERPRDLAYLLGNKLAGKSAAEIDRLQATGDERVVKFRKKIPIYILYFTTWVADDGTVRYHTDVYGHDEALEPQTRKFETRT